jgi:hypothetical protein
MEAAKRHATACRRAAEHGGQLVEPRAAPQRERDGGLPQPGGQAAQSDADEVGPAWGSGDRGLEGSRDRRP